MRLTIKTAKIFYARTSGSESPFIDSDDAVGGFARKMRYSLEKRTTFSFLFMLIRRKLIADNGEFQKHQNKTRKIKVYF